jgi:hypothetical protein
MMLAARQPDSNREQTWRLTPRFPPIALELSPYFPPIGKAQVGKPLQTASAHVRR